MSLNHGLSGMYYYTFIIITLSYSLNNVHENLCNITISCNYKLSKIPSRGQKGQWYRND